MDPKSNIQLIPSDKIVFKSLSPKDISSVLIKNSGFIPIYFKIKVSSPKDFLVSPNSGAIPRNSETVVSVSFIGTPESSSKPHKFLIQTLACTDSSKVDWTRPDVKEFKLPTKFEIGELLSEDKYMNYRDDPISKNESMQDYNSSSNKDSVYGEPEEDYLALEDQKKTITAKNSDLTSNIDKLTAEIENAKHKLKFSKDLEIITSESMKKYGVHHLAGMFVIGILIGYYILG